MNHPLQRIIRGPAFIISTMAFVSLVSAYAGAQSVYSDQPATNYQAPSPAENATPFGAASTPPAQLPTVQQQGGISFVTGGIGDGERASIEGARHDYTVHITNSNADGAYVSDVTLTVYDRKGNAVLNTLAGPLFYVALPHGKYTIVGDYNGTQQKKAIRITRAALHDIHFIWK